MSDKMTHAELMEEIECELNSAEDSCRNANSYACDAESNSYEAKDNADDARYSVERVMELMKQIKPNPGIKVYVLYIGGKVDSYHHDTEYIKMFAELFPTLQDSLAVEKYWINDLGQMLDFMSRIAGVDITSTSEGIMSRIHDIKKDRFKNYDRDISPAWAESVERVALWRNESAGYDLSDWLGIKKPIEQKLLDGEIDFNETMTPELKERLLKWAEEQKAKKAPAKKKQKKEETE